MCNSKLTDIILTNGNVLPLYSKLPASYIHSDEPLEHPTYLWNGEVEVNELSKDATLAVIDTFAYHARHQETGDIVRIRTGSFKHRGRQFCLKLLAVIDGDKLQLVVEPAKEHMSDIAPLSPVKISGVSQAVRKFRSEAA
jgi:hypothetical protein